MTSALSELYPPSGQWTTDDLGELPEIRLPIREITPRFYRPEA